MWSEIGLINLIDEWQFSQPSDASLFRVIQTSSLGFYGLGVIAQASSNEALEIFEPQKFYLTFPEIQVFRLRKPPCFLNRTIAVKGRRYRFPLGLTIKIEQFLGSDDMPLNNPLSFQKPSTAISSTVAASATSVSLLAGNAARAGFSVWNSSTAILYLDYDAAATAADYAVRIDPGGYFESPVAFTGQVSAIWSAANGSALVREFS